MDSCSITDEDCLLAMRSGGRKANSTLRKAGNELIKKLRNRRKETSVGWWIVLALAEKESKNEISPECVLWSKAPTSKTELR